MEFYLSLGKYSVKEAYDRFPRQNLSIVANSTKDRSIWMKGEVNLSCQNYLYRDCPFIIYNFNLSQ